MRKTYSSALWRVPTKEKVIFLTFDDGPIPEITPWVLDTLNEFKAKATFFCVGANIEKHPVQFERILSDGHAIGNHTYNHCNGWTTETKVYLQNVSQWEKCASPKIKNNKPRPSFFRPPYGKMTLALYRKLIASYTVVMWDVISGDFDNSISEEKCLENAISNAREGSIVVFHDNLKADKNLRYALPRFLKHFKEAGYTFELIPAQTPYLEDERTLRFSKRE